MTNLKPCPFCGLGMVSEFGDLMTISHPSIDYDCPLSGMKVTGDHKEINEWNHRPLEDTLRAELAKANALLDYVEMATATSIAWDDLMMANCVTKSTLRDILAMRKDGE